jgi:enoyl-CoA hydratase
MSQELILKAISGRVMVITLNRAEALNALSQNLISQLNDALRQAENNPDIGAIVLTGSNEAFAAGADIREMKDLTFPQIYSHNFIDSWEYLAQCRKVVIAAVSGYALGGGCELALMCDIILASDTAQFGQPEITLGTIPGAGGTQRLTRLIGKTKAMELCLTGRMMGAQEAERCGFVTRVVPVGQLRAEAIALAQKIASFSQPAVQMIKEAIRASENMSLGQGIRFERRLFESTFSLKDREEGMAAFLEKRIPVFNHE